MANKLLIFTIILPIIAFLTYYRLERAGIFRPELRHYEHPTYQRCWKMDLKGVDDFSINPKGRFVFLSALNKRQYLLEGIEDPTAGIYAFNLTTEPKGNIVNKVNLVNFPPNLKLHPHGISFFETKRNEQFLFVIDHQRDGEYVQIFEYKKEQLYWKRNVTSPLFTSLNGIVGVSNTSFYVTNDHQFGSPLLFAEDLLGLCLGSVLYYDGQTVSTALSNLCVPNGIDITPDLTTLYLTQSQIGTVTIYKRDKKNSTLTELKKIELDFGVDNIKVQKNQLTVGGHRNVIEMYSYIFFKTPCPSTVVRLTLDKDLDPTIERMYSDDGKLGSFTTGGIISLGRLLIGSGMDDYLTICENPEVIPAKGKLTMKEMARLEKEIMKAEKNVAAEEVEDF